MNFKQEMMERHFHMDEELCRTVKSDIEEAIVLDIGTACFETNDKEETHEMMKVLSYLGFKNDIEVRPIFTARINHRGKPVTQIIVDLSEFI